MSKILTNNQYYYQIANVIREQNGTSNTYTPPQMVRALKDLFYEEVEGVPPISFNGIGENLLDYRIDGASGGVGDRTKNLLQNTAVSRQIGNVVFNVIADGTIICEISDGNPVSQNIGFIINSGATLNAGVYSINGCPTGGGSNFKIIAIFDVNGEQVSAVDTGQGTTVTFDYNANIAQNGFYIAIYKNAVFDTLIFKPMIRLASIEDDTYEPYGYKVPIVVSGKNLFDETQVPDKSTSTETSNYQIFKQNGKLIVNGITTSSQVDTEISKENGVNNQALDFINNNAGNYIFTSSVPGRIMIRYKQNGSDVVRYTFNEYNSTNKIADRIVFRLQQNYQYDNETMNIMFKLNKIQSTNYEPYHEPTTTTIYLDEPIEENESISLSDTNTNIPTIRGTNVLTVDTTVQPSNVYIKARKESSYETAMREDYGEQLSDIESALQEV